MQWNDDKNAGFTEGTPWIGVNPDYKEINAKQELEDSESVFYYYQKLIRLRKENEIFIKGEFRLLMEEDENIFAYVREYGEQKLLVVANFTEKEAAYSLEEQWKRSEVLIHNYKEDISESVLRPYEAFMCLL